MAEEQELPIIGFTSRAMFEDWLEGHGPSSVGLWLKIARKHSGLASVTYRDALDSALCFGWIDGQKGSFDDQFWLQRFTPRKGRSKWSQVNRKRAGELIELGLMREAGVIEVEKAKANGRWMAAYESQKTIQVPADLQAALDQDPEAAAFFATLDSRNRYAILYRIADAEKAATREARIKKFVTLCRENQVIYP